MTDINKNENRISDNNHVRKEDIMSNGNKLQKLYFNSKLKFSFNKKNNIR